jgi:hypothetical protein
MLQLRYMQMNDDSASVRYKPVKSLTHGGIVLLSDQTPSAVEILVPTVAGMCFCFIYFMIYYNFVCFTAGGLASTQASTSASGAPEVRTPPGPFNLSVARYSQRN